ncbi:hypothetical protein OSCT_2445 [Oscillochloris trichoides DG-6]|uniref:Uncharacterized protein n=1 Tax=Oscillochloris trichoides DG-6 TaxID=765420 RepID=E1IGJ4_9CHLR|nr:glycosyltransferase family 39 protein [Oscillochloris trichoides]EFO79760.1 hypothetical protein OSCT_2445 [Oscillochloris trichoides DG-6]
MTDSKPHKLLWVALLLGLGLRLALWGQLPRLGLIGDEAEYLAAADWLAHGRGFAWHLHYLWTRAPLYPLFLAAHLALFGNSLTPIFLSQIGLSLLNIGLIYTLGRLVLIRIRLRRVSSSVVRHINRRGYRGTQRDGFRATWGSSSAFLCVLCGQKPGHKRMRNRVPMRLVLPSNTYRYAPGIAAILGAIYLPFATYPQLILSETLFTSLLLGSLVALARWAQQRDWRWLIIAGLLLGLATLTRGLTLGFVPLVLLWVGLQAKRQWLSAVAILAVTFTCILAPWSLYASRTYGGMVLVDTTGAFNLALGARTAYDGGRSDAPLRNFILALLEPTLSQEQRSALVADQRNGACLYAAGDVRLQAALDTPVDQITQAERQALLNAEASCLLRQAPLAFVQKSLIELTDLFQINYTGDERLSKGFALGRLPPWYSLALFLLDDTLYVLCLPLAVLGWGWLRRQQPQSSAITLVGLWLLYNLGTAPLLFAINRFRVPLMPLVLLLAAYALATLFSRERRVPSGYTRACAALALLLGLIASAPYAYLEPRAAGQASRWASYLGPYPSSLENTRIALRTRPAYLAEQRLASALSSAAVGAAQAALNDPDLPTYAVGVGAPLLAGLQGDPAGGMDRLAQGPEQPLEGWQRSLIAGQLFRQMGDLEAARREFSPAQVDDQNPVAWAWQWLAPPPTNRIDLAGDNDLGYILGFYLGRYDPDLKATLRWASGDAALRFPRAASGYPQQLCLSISGLGWPSDMALPSVQVRVGTSNLGQIALSRELRTECLALPAQAAGSDLIVTLHADTFVPDALDLVRQQGPQVGQLRRLAYQLDWAEVR